MLTELEFKGKKHIIMAKPAETIIMTKKQGDYWEVYCISKRDDIYGHEETIFSEDDAYEYYMDRMESFGFKQFPIIVE